MIVTFVLVFLSLSVVQSRLTLPLVRSLYSFIFITWMVDRIGRRKPLVYGGVAMAVCLAWQAGVASSESKSSRSSRFRTRSDRLLPLS